MMTLDVGPDYLEANATALERALAARRSELQSIDGEEERERRAFALAAMEGYALLLREPIQTLPVRNLVRYAFKLVFPDGRWAIDEQQLLDAPRAGDVVVFGGGGWRIEGSQRVGVKPAGKPPREFFVCAPAGA
jgi:hypothetical protein